MKKASKFPELRSTFDYLQQNKFNNRKFNNSAQIEMENLDRNRSMMQSYLIPQIE